MNYWHMQLHPNDKNAYTPEEILQIIKDKGVIGMGESWDNDKRQPEHFKEDAAIGDIVVIRHGPPICLVEIISECKKNDGKDKVSGVWFTIYRDVKILAEDGPEQQNTFETKYKYRWSSGINVRSTFNAAKDWKFIKYWYNNYIRSAMMEKYKTLLLNNKNIVLSGAPGTGKTYLAKEIAKSIGAKWELVQFHPSYDYTDFVEGLRPIKDEDKLGFERKDGVFKTFCKKAIKASQINGVDNFDETWNALIEEIDKKTFVEVPLISGSRKLRIELNEYGTGLTERTYDANGEKVRGASKFFTKQQLRNIYEGRKGVESGGHDTYRKAIISEMIKKFGLKEYKKPEVCNENTSKFVFIIDEINRGEISKIFGELFFSIDPPYRGKKGLVNTQYQNLIDQSDIFYKGFYVPENVYIIGTMNDIDRSVESMDFAMRRRFAWEEITAVDRQSMLDDERAWDNKKPADGIITEIKNRMNNLNDCIIDNYKPKNEVFSSKDRIGLTKAYQIGAAYFLKYGLYDNFNDLWANHLKGLLYEYLRGTTNIEEKIERLHKAYNDITSH